MRTVRVTRMFAATIGQAERLWYDTARWAEWVDGLEEVVTVTGDWPRTGAVVTWRSGPAGRGRVTERVVSGHPDGGQTVAVADDAIRGEQRIGFAPAAPGVEVTLALSYALTRRNPVTWLVDALFIRRAMDASLDRTLERFGAVLEGT
jgi:hypothetical protein